MASYVAITASFRVRRSRHLLGIKAPLTVPMTFMSFSPLHAPRGEENNAPKRVRIVIRYCTGCQWMLRSTYLASELLTTFKDELSLGGSEIAIQPVNEPTGVFQVLVNDEKVWDRTDVDPVTGEKVGFPETKILKQLVRDLVLPEKSLGHSDT